MTGTAPVVIVGGGPAGMVAGLLLARAGVAVTVLEKHADFFRDFRGDTVHPSTLDLFDDIGLLGALLALPHAAIDTMTLDLLGRRYTIATLKHLPVAAPFIAMMPQWDLLDFIAREGRKYRTFDLRMSTEATGLRHDPAGRVDGVTLASGETLPARLVIAADGRRSVLRDAARLPLDDLGAPMDVLWFRVPMPADLDMTEVPLGTIDKGGMVVAIPRGDYWQCAQIIEKGGFAAVKARGIAAFRETIVAICRPSAASGSTLRCRMRWPRRISSRRRSPPVPIPIRCSRRCRIVDGSRRQGCRRYSASRTSASSNQCCAARSIMSRSRSACSTISRCCAAFPAAYSASVSGGSTSSPHLRKIFHDQSL